jgi:predicted RNase H-like HicB family nuclease
MSVKCHKLDLVFRVLLYQDDGEYVAHAVELDLLGMGNSPNKAIADLRGAIEAQVTFAMQKKDPGLLSFPAPTEVATRWQEAQRKELCDLATGDVSIEGRCRAMVIEIPSSELTALRRAAARKVYDRQPISA